MKMIGENIQMVMGKLQTARPKIFSSNPGMLGDLRDRVKNMQILKSNPGILGNIPMARNIQSRIQSIRSTGVRSLAPTKTASVYGQTPSSTIRKVVSV
jgi:hypothetical protein